MLLECKHTRAGYRPPIMSGLCDRCIRERPEDFECKDEECEVPKPHVHPPKMDTDEAVN